MNECQVWQRPGSVPVPTVWARYESQRPMPNGRFPKFLIQDYSQEWKDQVVYNMKNFFLRDEPLSKSVGLLEDEIAIEEYIQYASDFLDRKMVLIAIVENLEELGDESLPRLAGCNLTGVTMKEEPVEKTKSERVQLIFDALTELKRKKNPFEHYQVTECLYAIGLSVHPSFRGHDLGHRILQARFPLCKAVGIKATVTVFTSAPSQKAAKKAGFELLSEIRYDEWKNKSGKVIFEIDSPKSMQLMGVRIP